MYQKLLTTLMYLGLTACSQVSVQETQAVSPQASDSIPLSLGNSLANSVFSPSSAAASLPSLNSETVPHGLLQTQTYHGDEVTATSGEQWWGLFMTNNGFELLPTTITINTVRDMLLDSEEGEFTGKEVVTDREAPSVFLVKDLNFLESGSVKTIFSGSATIPSSVPQANGPLSLSLIFDAAEDLKNPVEYRFSLTDTTEGEVTQTILTFSEDGNSQQYQLENCCDWTSPKLLWAGDLDRDGRLDFLIDTATHYNVSEPTLFLSSPAQEGEIVRPVARMRSVGG